MVIVGSAKAQLYTKVDAHALAASPEDEKSAKALAKYLAKPCKTDKEKARVIFRWVADRISYDADALFSGKIPDQAPDVVLSRRTAVCEGYANLFLDLASRIGLKAVKVRGWAKGIDYDTRRPPNHAWNAFEAERAWHLVDATWGAGSIGGEKKFVKRFAPCYFCVPGEQLGFSHLPTDVRWQLRKKPLTPSDFDRQPKVDQTLWEMGVTADRLAGEKDIVQALRTPAEDLTFVKGPLAATLRKGKEYNFEFHCKDFAQMAIVADGVATYLQKDDDAFRITYEPNTEKIVIAGKVQPDDTKFQVVLVYSCR
jgi:hypothetical protein